MKQKQRGISLVIVILLVSMMVTMAAMASVSAANMYRQITRTHAANQAYYAAEGALEEALLTIKQYGTGFNQSASTETEIKNESLMKNYEADCKAAGATAGGGDDGSSDDTDGTGTDDTGKPADANDSTKPKDGKDSLVPGIDCKKVLEITANSDKPQEKKIKAKWKLVTSSPQDVDYQVQLKDDGSKYYSIPIAGTGTAGGTLCAPGKIIPLINGDATVADGMVSFVKSYNLSIEDEANDTVNDISEATPAADHPCHWNRLYVSDVGSGDKPGTVTIPLFVQDLVDVDENSVNDLLIRNPANSFWINGSDLGAGPQLVADADTVHGGGLKFMDNSELYLRFRTLCKPLQVTSGSKVNMIEREMCSPDERYLLDDGDNNDVVVAWKIEETQQNPCGTVQNNGTCNPAEDDDHKIKHSVGPIMPKNLIKGKPLELNVDSTEIRESFVNDIEPYFDAILHYDTKLPFDSNEPTLTSFLLNYFEDDFGQQNDFSQWRLYKPVLELANISTLDVQDTGIDGIKNIPYLEYQLLSSVTFQPFSDVYQTVTAEGIVNGIKQTIRVKIPQGGNLLQYVIQQ